MAPSFCGTPANLLTLMTCRRQDWAQEARVRVSRAPLMEASGCRHPPDLSGFRKPLADGRAMVIAGTD